MKNLKHIILNTFFKQVDSIGLSIFRIVYSSIFLFEVFHLFKYRSITYENITEINPTTIFIFWIPIVIMMILGYKTKLVTIINYILTVIMFSAAEKFEYHGFTIYLGVNFLMVFMPLSNYFSLDALNYQIKKKEVFQINYLAPIFLVIALIYFDSAFYKYASSMWLKGLGLWLPASLPMATWSSFQLLLNNEILVKFMSWFVLIFETVFVLLMWVRVFRVPLMIIGILFHLGILFFFPIPWFALADVCVYLLFVPQSFWQKKLSFFRLKKYQNNKKIEFQMFQISELNQKRFWLGLITLIFTFQFLLTFRTPVADKLFDKYNLSESRIVLSMKSIANKTDNFAHRFLGITNHGLFLDAHFFGYDKIIKVEMQSTDGKHIILPIIKNNGQPGDYITGTLWANYTFRVSSANLNLDSYFENVVKYLNYYCKINNINKSKVSFLFYSKEITIPEKWEVNYFEKMVNRKWRPIGKFKLKNGKLIKI